MLQIAQVWLGLCAANYHRIFLLPASFFHPVLLVFLALTALSLLLPQPPGAVHVAKTGSPEQPKGREIEVAAELKHFHLSMWPLLCPHGNAGP